MGGSRQSFLNTVMMLVKDAEEKKTKMPSKMLRVLDYLMNDVESNLLVHSLCADASMESQHQIYFLYQIPRNVVALRAAPLINGFLRKKSHTRHLCVPPDVASVIGLNCPKLECIILTGTSVTNQGLSWLLCCRQLHTVIMPGFLQGNILFKILQKF